MCVYACGVFYFYVIFKPTMYKTHEQSRVNSVSLCTSKDHSWDVPSIGIAFVRTSSDSLILVQVKLLTIFECVSQILYVNII